MRPLTKALVWIIPIYAAGVLSGLFIPSKGYDSARELDRLRVENIELTNALDQAKHERSHLKSELSRIAEVDLSDYLRLQKEEEQFQKSREILGKVFLVLFHNLLQGMPQDQVDFARSAAGSKFENPTPAQESTRVASQPPAPAPITEKSSTQTSPNETGLNQAAATTWNQAEKELSNLNPAKTDAFLQSTVIQDVASETKGYRSFNASDTRLVAMQGSYSGPIVFLDARKKPWSLEMTLNTEIKDGIPLGNFAVRIVDDHGNISNHSGNGSIRGIIQPVTPSRAVIVKLGDTRFLQMYILENQETIIGNLYDETQIGKVERLGTFRLQR